MEKSVFHYGGVIGGLITGGGASFYIGAGYGFKRDEAFGNMHEQYKGMFIGFDTGFSIKPAPLGIGFGGFMSPPGADPMIRALYVSMSLSYSILPVSIGGTVTLYQPSISEPYPFVREGYVDVNQVVNNVILGALSQPYPTSNLQLFTHPFVSALATIPRITFATTIAAAHAKYYNEVSACERNQAKHLPVAHKRIVKC